jgi:L-2,4-diaminobutyric acid acetyltransferase
MSVFPETTETTNLTRIRAPERGDGSTVWRLARDSGALELNSAYAYLLWCDRFADSSALAEVDGQPAGFVCGFRPPRQPDTLFVWQVAVHEDRRGMGLAGRMIAWILGRDPALRFLEATVAPSNTASQRLFRSIARSLGCPCDESPHFRPEEFPEGNHEAEHLFRIGPIRPTSSEHGQEIR